MSTKKTNLSAVAVMSLFILANGQVIINPALQGISQLFPQIDYSTILLLATVPNLMVAVTSILSGAIAGSKVRYRTLTSIACLLFAVGGVLPLFLRSFPALLAARAVFGAGVGLATPMGNAILMQRYHGSKQAAMIGYGSSVMCAAGIAYQTISGFVSAVNVQLMWLIHLIALLPLALMLLFFKEPKLSSNQKRGLTKSFTLNPFGISCLFALIFMLFYPVMLNMSAIITTEGLGNASITGIVQTMYTIGGALGGILFGKLRSRLQNKTVLLTLSALILGLLLCGTQASIPLLCLGTFLCGLGVFMTASEVLLCIGAMVSPEKLSISTGLMMSVWNLGTFASTGYIKLLEYLGSNKLRLPIQISCGIVLIILVLWARSDRHS